MKYLLLLIALICIPFSCTNDDNYSQLQEWRTELRTEIVEARRNVNSTSDLTLRSDIYINEVVGFYIWLKNNLAEDYVDSTCDDELFDRIIRSQLDPVSLLIQISPPEEDPFELFPLPVSYTHLTLPTKRIV